MNDALAEALGLLNPEGLVKEKTEPLLKVAAYVEFVKAKEFKGLLEKNTRAWQVISTFWEMQMTAAGQEKWSSM